MRYVEHIELLLSLEMFFSVIRPFVFASMAPTEENRHLPAYRDWGMWTLSSLMFPRQRRCPALEKDISWIVKRARRGWEKIYTTFKGAERKFTIANFLKLMLSAKGGQRPRVRKKSCLKFSQAEGNVKDVLGSSKLTVGNL